ncbi:MAG TPA: restriction endonuclease subunit S [Phycisphaerales bacterium]|jgi:type I restriction enzyme S subunit|nr:restriction endonuclease subunit S [Phycisphaerales bacterium]
MNTAWPPTPLSRALRQVEDVVHLEDRKEYQQVTVSLHGRGLRLRQVVKGADVKTKRQFRVRAGQFVYSRIDARNGAFGLVPPELDGAVVSNDFPVFDVAEDVAESKFIAYLTQSRWFVAQCEDPSRGVTNRQRMAEELLLALKVPMPPLAEQRRIIHAIDAVATRIAEAQRLRESVEVEREEMLRAFARELAKGAARRPLQQVAPVTRRPVKIDKGAMYPELGIRSFGRGTFHKPAISGANLGRKRLFHIRPGDLVFSNVFSWEGAIAVAKDEDEGRVGSHRFITCVPDPALATAEFLRSWLLTDEGMSFILEASPGAAGRNRTLGLKKLVAIPVPLPPLEAQQRLTQLSRHLADARQTQVTVAEELKSMLPAVLDLAFRGEL